MSEEDTNDIPDLDDSMTVVGDGLSIIGTSWLPLEAEVTRKDVEDIFNILSRRIDELERLLKEKS